jgi:methyl-CpG-binding domain protein 4
MAKRQFSDHAHAGEHSTSRRPPKRRKKYHPKANIHDENLDEAAGTVDGSPPPGKGGKFDASRHSMGTVENAPGPSSRALNKSQLRRKAKRDALQARAKERREHKIARSQAKSIQSRAPAPAMSLRPIDRLRLLEVATTNLMPRIAKVWHESTEHSGPSADSGDVSTSSVQAAASQPVHVASSSESIAEAPKLPQSASNDVAESTRDGLPSSSTGSESPSEHSVSQSDLDDPMIEVPRTQDVEDVTLSPQKRSSSASDKNVNSRQITHIQPIAALQKVAIAFRRTSFHTKAQSVPTHFTQGNALENFKRFNKMLHDGHSDSSDDDSSSSDGDSENDAGLELKPSGTGSFAENLLFTTDPEARDDGQSDDGNIHASQESTDVEEIAPHNQTGEAAVDVPAASTDNKAGDTQVPMPDIGGPSDESASDSDSDDDEENIPLHLLVRRQHDVTRNQHDVNGEVQTEHSDEMEYEDEEAEETEGYPMQRFLDGHSHGTSQESADSSESESSEEGVHDEDDKAADEISTAGQPMLQAESTSSTDSDDDIAESQHDEGNNQLLIDQLGNENFNEAEDADDSPSESEDSDDVPLSRLVTQAPEADNQLQDDLRVASSSRPLPEKDDPTSNETDSSDSKQDEVQSPLAAPFTDASQDEGSGEDDDNDSEHGKESEAASEYGNNEDGQVDHSPNVALQLPTSDGVQASQTSNSSSSWPANVGIKRTSSFLGRQAGGILSAPGGHPPAHKNLKPGHPDLFEISEAESVEAIKTMEDISEHLLQTTPQLHHPSKLNMKLDLRDLEGAEGLMFLASSDRLVSRIAHFRYHERAPFDHTRFANPLVCNSVRVSGPMLNPLRIVDHNVDSALDYGNYKDGPTDKKSPAERSSTSSPLSELSRSPSLPRQSSLVSIKEENPSLLEDISSPDISLPSLATKKRKMTGRTSKHFTPPKLARHKSAPVSRSTIQSIPPDERSLQGIPASEGVTRSLRRRERKNYAEHVAEDDDLVAVAHEKAVSEPEQAISPILTPVKKSRKSTGKRSGYFTPSKPELDLTVLDRVDLYNTTSSGRKARVPAGTSTAPVPSINCSNFGIIQEKLWREPFWLLIAVTFLNKTTGRAAVPIFWKLKEQYPTPEALAGADEEVLKELIWHLGLQTQRSRRLIKIANAWVEQPPTVGRRWRTLHYPLKGDGKEFKGNEVVEEDADDVEGALEIGHIPGCGPYAWDSWRIFCRDVLRGVAEDYSGKGAIGDDFVPEWKKVLPLDKELRACLRWMWLREGWIWDCETGERREATDEEMEKAVKGEMEIADPQERKFAAQAVGGELSENQNRP